MTVQNEREEPHRELLAHSTFGIKNLFSQFLDWVFPPACSGCGRVDYRWCPACHANLLSLPDDTIYVSLSGFDGVVATSPHTGILQQAIHALKYEGQRELARPLARRLHRALQQTDWMFDILIPVPLHDSRLRERGYNQSKELADALAMESQAFRVSDSLRRTRHTQSQVGLGREERIQNMAEAFEAVELSVQSKRILIVDDVRTTGATLSACADALRATGATAVYAATVTYASLYLSS